MADKQQPKPAQKAPEPKPTPEPNWAKLAVQLMAANAEVELARAKFRGDNFVISNLEPVLVEVRNACAGQG